MHHNICTTLKGPIDASAVQINENGQWHPISILPPVIGSSSVCIYSMGIYPWYLVFMYNICGMTISWCVCVRERDTETQSAE